MKETVFDYSTQGMAARVISGRIERKLYRSYKRGTGRAALVTGITVREDPDTKRFYPTVVRLSILSGRRRGMVWYGVAQHNNDAIFGLLARVNATKHPSAWLPVLPLVLGEAGRATHYLPR